jgi:hypothetical protein
MGVCVCSVVLCVRSERRCEGVTPADCLRDEGKRSIAEGEEQKLEDMPGVSIRSCALVLSCVHSERRCEGVTLADCLRDEGKRSVAEGEEQKLEDMPGVSIRSCAVDIVHIVVSVMRPGRAEQCHLLSSNFRVMEMDQPNAVLYKNMSATFNEDVLM